MADEPTYRGMDGNNQLVEINGRWAYAWGGDPLLEIGEWVVLPSTKGPRGSWWIGQVTDFGSAWTGTHKHVLRIATGDDLREYHVRKEAREMAIPMRERIKRRGS